jgi:hypothetical protein
MSGFLRFLDLCTAVIAAMCEEDEPPALARPATSPTLVHYRTRDGEAFYSFSIEERSGGGYRSYIVAQPDYGNRATDAHSTHRHWDGGRPYVCWSKPITSEQDALRVCAAWADATQQYIKTGQKF